MDFYISAIIQGFGYASMAMGIFISLRIFNIPDITTDGSFTLGGAVTAVGLMAGWHPLLTLLAAMLCGAISGIATGLIHTTLRIHALLAGILVMTALYSVNLSIMGRSNIPLTDAQTLFDLLPFPTDFTLRKLMVMASLAIVLIIFLTWLLKTDFGIAMRATGDNSQMVRSMGVNTAFMKITGLALANSLTAFSGYLLVQYQGFSDINMGIGIVISGLAAVMIGEALAGLLAGKLIVIQLVGVVAGSILFRVILAGSLSMGLNPNYLKLVTAAIVLLVVATTRYKGILK